MHNHWLRGAGNILNELFTSIILMMFIKENLDEEENIILCLELNQSKLDQKPLCVLGLSG